MQQWWFDDGLGLKSVIYGVFFMIFPLFLRFSLICNLGYLHLRSWDERQMYNFLFGTKTSSL